MRISVVMCTYNGAKFLREQLDSIASQILLPDELVVCDDGSTDATLSILKEYACSVKFSVRALCNPSRLGAVKNFGLCQLVAYQHGLLKASARRPQSGVLKLQWVG